MGRDRDLHALTKASDADLVNPLARWLSCPNGEKQKEKLGPQKPHIVTLVRNLIIALAELGNLILGQQTAVE